MQAQKKSINGLPLEHNLSSLALSLYITAEILQVDLIREEGAFFSAVRFMCLVEQKAGPLPEITAGDMLLLLIILRGIQGRGSQWIRYVS